MSFLKINNLSVNYEMRRETVYAAKEVNINVEKGEILGSPGEDMAKVKESIGLRNREKIFEIWIDN